MRVTKLVVGLLFVFCQLQIPVPHANALGSPDVVIAQLYPGATNIATQEFVELYNNSTLAVNVTGWCVSYVSATGGTSTKLGCLTAPDNSTSLWLKAGGYATFISNEYQSAFQTKADVTFAGGMSATAGHVRLTNAANSEVDRLGWGNAVNSEVAPATAPANAKSLLRKSIVPNGLQDTDINANDFLQSTPLLHASDVYEVVTVIDVCTNISDIQLVMPIGYLTDENGLCQPDSCLNIAGLQTSVPLHYDSDPSGNCLEHDECSNLTGTQVIIPENMLRGDVNTCIWDIVPLQLTELLPNAIGTDTGNEFIELYNPSNRIVDLSLYSIVVGVNGEKSYSFPKGVTIAPGEYRAFNDDVTKLTLINTISRVQLVAVDGSQVADSGNYESPADGQSWALIGDSWQYTNQPTPGASNAPSAPEEIVIIDATDTSSNSAPCPAGKYRNPRTNRCRSIESDATVLASCDTDQYRNPETGRCRKITIAQTTSLCKDGQYRSEETNRCRNIVTASSQKPCKETQYRSEETGRCRNLPASGVPAAAFAVQPIAETGMAFVGWWALGGVGLLAVGYAGWEWRREIANSWQRFTGRFGQK